MLKSVKKRINNFLFKTKILSRRLNKNITLIDLDEKILNTYCVSNCLEVKLKHLKHKNKRHLLMGKKVMVANWSLNGSEDNRCEECRYVFKDTYILYPIIK